MKSTHSQAFVLIRARLSRKMCKQLQQQSPGGKGEVVLQVNDVLFTFHLDVTAAKRESE